MNRSRIAAVALTLAAGAVALPAAPAHARWSDCGNDYLCLWGNNTYSGAPWFEKKANGDYNTGYWNNDETSSVANRSGVSSAYLYNDTNQSATHGVVCLPREYSAYDLNETDPEFDDRISSIRIASGACNSNISRIGYEKYS